MRRLIVAVMMLGSLLARAQQGNNQANIGGLLIASNFAQWTIPQGNQGGYSWSSPDFCKVNFAGTTFNAFSNGTPVQIVDTGNPNNSEVVTVARFNSQVNGCSIQVSPTHVHNTFFFRSATGGLGEAMAFAGTQLYQVILTPDWTKLGGTTAMITSQVGNTNVTIMDQRTAQLLPYAWGGSAYVAQPFTGPNPPTGAAGGVLSGVYPNPGLASSGAIPTGWTATTASFGDNSGLIATTAYVQANKGGGAAFSSTPGVVYNTSATASRNATASDFNTIYGYTPLSPSYFGTLPGCGTSGNVFTPAGANCVPNGSSPSGAAGGALSGTYPNPGIVGTTVSPKIINGVSYSNQYTGATVDVRVNACLADAMALSNGNTTSVCDASGDGGSVLTTAHTINVGNTSGAPVTLILPATGQWLGGMTDGTSSTVNQYGNTSIIGKGPESGIGSQFVIGATSTSNLAYVFRLTPLGSQLNYIHDSYFSIVNVNGGPYIGHVTTSGIGAKFQGPMYDSSTIDHVVVFDALDPQPAVFDQWCCGAVARNMQINGNYGSGVTPLTISNTSAFNAETLSIVHPGAGHPLINFIDSTAHTSNANLISPYFEGSNTDTTTNWIHNDGYGSINLSDVTAKAEASGVSATFMTSTATTNTGITISGFNAVNGGGDWFYPVTVLNDAYTAQIAKTDSTGAKGNLGYFASNGASVGSLSTYGGNITIGPVAPAYGSYSGQLVFQAPYNTGSGPALDTYDQYIQIGSGVNPFSQYVFDHPSGSPGGGGYYFVPPVKFSNGVIMQSTVNISSLAPNNPVCTDGFSNLATSGCTTGSGISITPQQYGAKGDGLVVPNGCTTNGTTSIVCPAAPFSGTSTDVGKYVCVQGAGTSGATFCSQVATAVSNTTVTVSATPSTNVTQAPSTVGHDDVAAVQQCFNGSASGGVQCQIGTATPNQYLTGAGFLIVSAGLTVPTHANIAGASGGGQGTNIISEYNGDAISLPTATTSLLAGQPIQGVTFSNIDIVMDPLMANGRGIHFNAAAGVYGFGGVYYSTFDNVEVDNAAKECLWLDGGTSGADLPNQYITFLHFRCELPNQMHTAAAINGTGQMAQIIFQNGAIDGSTTHSNEPNPLISFSGSGGKFPADVKFYGYTCEVATTCLYVGPNTTNIHYDNGYFEQVDNALIVDTSAQGFTFNGNHLANTGNGTAVAQLLGGVTGSMRDNYVYGGSTPTAWAVCSGAQNSVVQSGNNGTNLQTSGCALQIAVSSGTQTANSCSSDTTISVPGITTDSIVTIGYQAASEAGVAGWGTTGGMRILGRPSATNTMSWHLCNPTGGNISYGAYTFKWGFTQQ